MRSTRWRPDRPDPARRGLGSSLEMLERRELLTQSPVNAVFAPWFPRELPISNPITNLPELVTEKQLVNRENPQSPLLNNQGTIVSGKDRQGDEWTITVHGPGIAIVTDTSPNDGVLDDQIDTIQLIGTNPTTTYVTGEVLSSFRVPTDGTIEFNKLIDTDGVKSIVLNGFTLAQTVAPSNGGVNNSQTGIFLYGGVGTLQFHDILAPIDTTTNDGPINVIIGDPSTPLTVEPTIKLDSIFNTVFSTTAAAVPTTPQTVGTVNIVVNGVIKGLDFISSTQHPTVDPAQELRTADEGREFSSVTTYNATNSPIFGAGNEFQFPIVGTTGRTSIQANAVNKLNVHGSAVNVTVSRGASPFQTGFSGISRLGSATFGGTADALGLDVNGPIGRLVFRRGLGNPTGANVGPPASANTNATEYGTPAAKYGYPANGLLGGLVTATKIGLLHAGAANTTPEAPTNPDYTIIASTGNPVNFPRAGNALTNAAITTDGSIRKVHVLGNLQNSEIKTGFNFASYSAGLVGTRAPSQIKSFHQKGDLIDSVVSSTYRPFNHQYQTSSDLAGPGKIKGNLNGSLDVTGATTALGNTSYLNMGVGFFARRKAGYLPPPEAPKRINNVPIR